jgi:hypothetical protein
LRPGKGREPFRRGHNGINAGVTRFADRSFHDTMGPHAELTLVRKPSARHAAHGSATALSVADGPDERGCWHMPETAARARDSEADDDFSERSVLGNGNHSQQLDRVN